MADQDLVNGLSKLVGYSIVLPAFFVLIPQILKVWEAGSGEGLSIPLQAQELAMLVIGSCYNWRIGLPLNAWGEAFPVGVQCLILLLLLVHFSPQSDKTVHVFLAFLGILIFCALIPLVGFALDLHITGPCLGYWGSYVQGALKLPTWSHWSDVSYYCRHECCRISGEDVHNAGGERPERGGGLVGDHRAHTQHRHLGAGVPDT